jgi:hypothetical protein
LVKIVKIDILKRVDVTRVLVDKTVLNSILLSNLIKEDILLLLRIEESKGELSTISIKMTPGLFIS